MPSFSTICLGSRNDADWWRRGLKEKLGFTEGKWLKEANPASGSIAAAFDRSDHWLYLGGHFSAPFAEWGAWPYPTEKRLYNDPDKNVLTPPTRELLLRFDGINVRVNNNINWSEQFLAKGLQFKQTSCKVVLFGGCAIAQRKSDIMTFQSLFNAPLLLGWTNKTSENMINLMLGGNGSNDAAGAPWSSSNFWDKLGQDYADIAKVRQAWLATANAIFTTGDPYRSHFAVVDAEYVHSLDKPPVKISDLPG